MIFAIWLILEAAVVAQGVLAWKMKLFTRDQGKIYGTAREKFLPFAEHAGMWSDFSIISPIVAWMIVSFGPIWSVREIIFIVSATAIINLVPILFWAKDSKEEPSAWNVNGKITTAGWIHYGYMTVGLSVVTLFYFCTPFKFVPPALPGIVSALLALHIFLGFGLTEYVTQRRVRLRAWIIIFVLWTCVFIGWLHL